MTLVNCTDADRETIEEYMVELDKAQNKNLSMLSTLREVRYILKKFPLHFLDAQIECCICS